MKIAQALMKDFAESTGLSSNRPARRYLWTDAFAVCNYIQLYLLTKDDIYKQLAIDLVDQVHNILGKFRVDDPREGYLSDEKHPTANGLRIGKPLPERRLGENLDERLEWERDGQYFHYLTKWMLALIRMGNFCKEEKYTIWAVDLLQASKKFIKDGRMYWKMSTDLSRPLVSSMGQHDPLDGYVMARVVATHSKTDLTNIIEEFQDLMNGVRLFTSDPLGVGGLLVSAYRLNNLESDFNLQQDMIKAAKNGIQCFNPNLHGLAFRELGLSIGLQAAFKLKKLGDYRRLRQNINEYWIENSDWKQHKDINQIMLATSLIPDEFLRV